jgi:hypothetical protein
MMKLLSLVLLFGVTVSAHAETAAQPRQYIVVGITGYGNEKIFGGDIFSDFNFPFKTMGVWKYQPTGQNVVRHVYLAQDSAQRHNQEVVNLMKDANGVCRADLGMVIESFSWGAVTAERIARLYQAQCGREVDLVVVIDGVAKPLPMPFFEPIPTKRCINYFQIESLLRGGPIPGCENHIVTVGLPYSVDQSHFNMQGSVSLKLQPQLQKFVDHQL